ncbi:MAG TPA: glutamate--tRNA ligase [Polyangiaceae bacterium]|jgi:glutamyl-tRNA synthetase|nr:glutamate--tRNA ligase [Polyangiaceae bacterium]
MTTRVRFAPSPTGYLHIGGVRTALFNWLWARKTKGVFVLRIEDTDQERSTPASRQTILDSMKWLGLDWDEGPEIGGKYGPYTQMERLAIYKEHAEKLIREKKAYRCYCTKAELDAQREALKKKDPKAQFRYPGTCRNRTDEPDLPYVVRFRTPAGGSVTYTDKVFGEVTTPNAAQQDFVLLRSDGVPLYNFGAVVDDMTMEISLVARGRDHMVNTPPQIMLYEAFGARAPDFAHLPMMLAQSGEKLSKRHGAVAALEYRDQGYSPNAVLNYLVRFGWSHGDQEVFSKGELIEAFGWAACGRGDGKFDMKKFLAINHAHLKEERLTPTDEYATRLAPFLEARGLKDVSTDATKNAVPLIRERATTFVDAADRLDFVFRADPQMDEAASKKFLVPAAAENLRALAAQLASAPTWEAKALEERVHAFLAEKNLQIKDVAQPARVALTGRTASPGLFEVIAALGKAESIRRLERAAIEAEKNA